MIIDPLSQLKIHSVKERGVPNAECIIIYAAGIVNLGGFALTAGIHLPNGSLLPLPDHFFWLGESVLAPQDWIFVYTGNGTPSQRTLVETNSTLHNVYWGRRATIFNQDNLAPMLFRIDAVSILPRPAPLVSLPGNQMSGGAVN